ARDVCTGGGCAGATHETTLVGGPTARLRAHHSHRWPGGEADGARAVFDSLLPSLLQRYPRDEGVAGHGGAHAGRRTVTDAARIYELLRFPPKGRLYQIVHRWSGRTAVVLTLPVAYHCVFLLGFSTHSPRVLIHSLLGSAFYGAVVAKVLIVRSTRFAAWV